MFSNLGSTNKVILTSLAIFAASFLLHVLADINVFLYISGFFLALYVPGLAIQNLYGSRLGLLNNLITAPLFTLFFFIPTYFFLTKFLLNGQINFGIAITSLTTVALFSVWKTSSNRDCVKSDSSNKKYVLFGISIFILFHVASTLVYKFIPEVDGYTDLLRVEKISDTGVFNFSQRPLFSFFMSYLTLISHISPYFLFKFGAVLIQTTGIYYLYQITIKANIQSSFIKYLVMASFISIPIVNLEIDYIRPNIIFIFALLPFIYYLSLGIESSKRALLLSTTIASVGLLFHDFFGALFLINALFITHYFYKNLSSRNRSLFLILLATCFLILLINIRHFPILPLFLYFAQQILQMVIDGLHWKWWFLNNYSNMDGNYLGWNGPVDVAKYYAYSLSPILGFALITFVITLFKKIWGRATLPQLSSIEKVALSVLSVGLLFAEILPRIDYPTLPDRFWPMTSLSILAILPFIISRSEFFKKKAVQKISLVLILIGIGGSLYIASAKGGYTSDKEYQAAQWILNNTPKNAIFITQTGNGPMINYFSKRDIIVPQSYFFLPDNALLQSKMIPKSGRLYNDITTLFNESLREPSDARLATLNTTLKKYHEEKEKEKLANDIMNPNLTIPPDKQNIYILYSQDKFNGYYANRDWWLTTNFYGADLNKFIDGYDLVYNDSDRVYIWKKR